MNTKAAHQALLQAARDRTTIHYGEIVALAELKLTGEALSGQLGWLFHDIVQTELAKDPAAPMLSAVALPKVKSATYLVPDVSQWQTWLSPGPADPSVAHEGTRTS